MGRDTCYNNVEIQRQIEEFNREAPKIQEKFDFEIPNYILDEMITDFVNKNNIIYLINLAIINNRISEENAEELKKYVVKKV